MAVGSAVTSTVDGVVISTNDVYRRDVRQKTKHPSYKAVNVKTPQGYVVKHFYVNPEVKVGDRVKAGETRIGSVQDLTLKYPGITNHVHVQVHSRSDPSKKIDPTPLFKNLQR